MLYPNRQRHASRADLQSMIDRIVYRGPDESGIWVNKNVGLAMRRLSIIDLKNGHQPMANEDGSVWIVFNGEIYNHNDIRRELEGLGYRYRSASDTETIIHLYEEYGIECVHYLEGMFAFAIWDVKRRALFGARDRFGIKPLYYHKGQQFFLFGSEIKSLLAHPGMKASLNEKVLSEYLAMGYVRGGDTLFESITELPPAHTLQVNDAGIVTVSQYWDLEAEDGAEKYSAHVYVEEYSERLRGAVRSHLLSDVPLGVFLSGGIDSSAVAAFTTQESQEQVDTFSVGYKESSFSELSYARQVSDVLGTRHHEVLVSRRDFFSSLPALTYIQDEPITWPSSVALFFLARLASEHVKVVLTGEGSDETLAGYSRYAYTLMNKKMDRAYQTIMPEVVRRRIQGFIDRTSLLSGVLRRKLEHTFLARTGESWEAFYFDNFFSAFSEAEQASLLAEPFGGSPYTSSMKVWCGSKGNLLQRMLYTDIKTYLVALLMKQDRMSMAASIESRVPFLDHSLAEYAFQIPPGANIRGLSGKHVLKNAMKDMLPSTVIFRKKLGFPTPWEYWVSGEGSEKIRSTLLESRTLSRGLFCGDAIRRLFSEHRSGLRDNASRIWRLLSFELWCRVFLDEEQPNLDLLIDPRAIHLKSS